MKVKCRSMTVPEMEMGWRGDICRVRLSWSQEVVMVIGR